MPEREKEAMLVSAFLSNLKTSSLRTTFKKEPNNKKGQKIDAIIFIGTLIQIIKSCPLIGKNVPAAMIAKI